MMSFCKLPAVRVVCGIVQNVCNALTASPVVRRAVNLVAHNVNPGVAPSRSASQPTGTSASPAAPRSLPVHYPVVQPLHPSVQQYPTGRVYFEATQPAYVQHVLAAIGILMALVFCFFLAELIVSLGEGMVGWLRYHLTIRAIKNDRREVNVTRLVNRRLRRDNIYLRKIADAAHQRLRDAISGKNAATRKAADAAEQKLQDDNAAKNAAARKTVDLRNRLHDCEAKVAELKNLLTDARAEAEKHKKVANDLDGREASRVAKDSWLRKESQRQHAVQAALEEDKKALEADKKAQTAEAARLDRLRASLEAEERAESTAQAELAACQAELEATKKALEHCQSRGARYRRQQLALRKQASRAARHGARRDAGGRQRTMQQAEEMPRIAQVDAAAQAEAAVSSESRQGLLLGEGDAAYALPRSAAASAGVAITPGEGEAAAATPASEDAAQWAPADDSRAHDAASSEDGWAVGSLSPDPLLAAQINAKCDAVDAVTTAEELGKMPMQLLLDPEWRLVFDVAYGEKLAAGELAAFDALLKRLMAALWRDMQVDWEEEVEPAYGIRNVEMEDV